MIERPHFHFSIPEAGHNFRVTSFWIAVLLVAGIAVNALAVIVYVTSGA